MLPDRPRDAAVRRHDRVVHAADAALAPDLDLRLPHPRGRLDRAAGARVHARRTVSPTSSRPSQRGLDVDEFAPRLSFFFNAQIDFFEEIAKYRAARRIWARELRETFGAKNERSWLMRFHTQTAGVSLTAQQPLNNIVRTAIEALAGVLGGTQSLHTNSYDEALALPTEEAVTVALRTQQVIAHETGVAATADPLGGSYFVEALTDEMEQRAYEYFAKIDELGGMVEAVKRNYPQREIADAAFDAAAARSTPASASWSASTATWSRTRSRSRRCAIDPGARAQAARPPAEPRARGATAPPSRRTLAALREDAAHAERNLMEPLLDCARAHASEGEIVESLQQVFGDYTRDARVLSVFEASRGTASCARTRRSAGWSAQSAQHRRRSRCGSRRINAEEAAFARRRRRAACQHS